MRKLLLAFALLLSTATLSYAECLTPPPLVTGQTREDYYARDYEQLRDTYDIPKVLKNGGVPTTMVVILGLDVNGDGSRDGEFWLTDEKGCIVDGPNPATDRGVDNVIGTAGVLRKPH